MRSLIIVFMFTLSLLIAYIIGTNPYYTENIPKIEVSHYDIYISIITLVLVPFLILLIMKRAKGIILLRIVYYYVYFSCIFFFFMNFYTFLSSLISATILTIIRFKYEEDLYIRNSIEMLCLIGASLLISQYLFDVSTALFLLFFIIVYDYIYVNSKILLKVVDSLYKEKILPGLLIKGKYKASYLGSGDIIFSSAFSIFFGNKFGIVYGYLFMLGCILGLFLLIYGRKSKYPATVVILPLGLLFTGIPLIMKIF